ncbi:MAG: transporter substrate-binding domain-containing protein [Sedimentibacter sp.]|uniref:transporter substrate-binding domain-containing protein n=1 Tax=Sedimentibacter sp. TaxID=1960295 RepID=UPI002981E014|nr:transporter substrate-binding domain-containing protein [Sedimentibacter sp.]MDW5299095.1 transporter substrate-binding domain-containing protein [Sedimentibacter sp.]
MSKKINIFNGLVILFLILILLFYIYDINNMEYLSDEEIEWLKERNTIIYAANENAPPLRFVDEIDNQYKGVVVDYINQLSLEIGVDIQTVPMQWDSALESLKVGETHICDMFINEERSKYYLFTDPIYNLRTVLLTRYKSDFDINQIDTMKIATEKGYYANNYLNENYPNAELVYTHNVEEGVDLFISGKVDAVIGDEPLITYLLVERNENLNPEYYNQILYEEEVVLAVSKTKPELVSILNKAISQINKKGQLEKIQQKWFGISTPLITNKTDSEIIENIVIFVIIACIIFVIIVLNNLSLKKQVKKRTNELEHSRNELQIIFDGITEYMLVIDQDRKIINGNKSIADFLGISSEQMVGQNCYKYINNFCNDCSNCLVEETLLNQKNIKKESMAGNEIYEINAQLLRGVKNTVLITIKNITIDKINRNQMLQTNKMIAVGQLAAGMAHEIRNPLGIIRTQSYLLRISDKIDEAMNKSLDYIDSSVNRASNIIDNILNFSRFSSNKKESVNLQHIIEKIIEMHNDIIKKENIKVSVTSNIKQEMNFNSESIEHIMLNLISNAVDAMENGGNLSISANLENDNIIIVCEDNGCSIDDNNIHNIFNPFFTTKELGKGTGLGLFIVYSEVEKLGGKIDVQSKLGEGTTFTIIIPVERKNN